MTDNNEKKLIGDIQPLDLNDPLIKHTLEALKDITPEEHEHALRRTILGTFNLTTEEEIDQKLAELRAKFPEGRPVTVDDLTKMLPGWFRSTKPKTDGYVREGESEVIHPTGVISKEEFSKLTKVEEELAPAFTKPSVLTGRLDLDLDLESTTPLRGCTPGFIAIDDAAFSKDCIDLLPTGQVDYPHVLNANPPSEELKTLAESLKHFEAPRFLKQPLDMDFASLGRGITELEMGNRRGEMRMIDSLSEMRREPLPANEEILTILFVQGGKSTATWHGKTLEERTSGDWTNPQRMAVHRTALALAWKTKFKEKMPLDLYLNISMDGTFSPFGARNSGVVARKIPTGKHSGSKAQQRNKAKRRK